MSLNIAIKDISELLPKIKYLQLTSLELTQCAGLSEATYNSKHCSSVTDNRNDLGMLPSVM